MITFLYTLEKFIGYLQARNSKRHIFGFVIERNNRSNFSIAWKNRLRTKAIHFQRQIILNNWTYIIASNMNFACHDWFNKNSKPFISFNLFFYIFIHAILILFFLFWHTFLLFYILVAPAETWEYLSMFKLTYSFHIFHKILTELWRCHFRLTF